MSINIVNLISSLESLGVDAEHARNAICELHSLLMSLDEVEVKGRQNVDTLLGCMMAIESIVGKEEKNGE